MSNLLEKQCIFDASMPIVARSAGRGIINSVNFGLIMSAQNMLRQERQLHPEGDIGGGIDEYNRLLSQLSSAQEEDENRVEQGHGDGVTELERCSMLRSIATWINETQLLPNATMVHYELSRVDAPNPFEVGDSVEVTLSRQILRAPRELTTTMKMEAAALGLPEEAILAGLQRQQAVNSAFLSDNRHYVLDIIRRMEVHALDETSVVAMFEKLSALDRLRVYAAADGMMYRVGITQGQRWVVNKVQEGKDNLAILNAERIHLREEINLFLKDPKVKKDISEAVGRGATLPVLQPLPPTKEQLEKRKTGTQ